MKIIAFEGIDGSGKTIQYNMLCNTLKERGYKVDTLEFPAYDSLFGKKIGELLAGKSKVDANSLEPMSMALWYAADRLAQFNRRYPEGISKADCDYLLLNRYVLSNAVYQSIRCDGDMSPEDFISWVFEMEHKELGLPYPDMYIFLDVSETQASENVEHKGYRSYIGTGKDVYESKENTQRDSRAAYMYCAEKFDNIKVVDCMENGKLKTPESIHQAILNLVI